MVLEKLIALISALIVTISMIYVNVNLYGGISIVSLFSKKKKFIRWVFFINFVRIS